jgi:hypothetical protein
MQIFPYINDLNMDVIAQPEVQDNGDFTMTAIWDFTDDSDFDIYNTSIKDGAVNLSIAQFFWNQSSQSDFIMGMHTKTNSTSFDDVVLAEEMKDVNLIKTGDFVSNQDWSYVSGNNITSLYNGTSQSADLGFVYSTGDNIKYLKPQNGEDDGHAEYWLSFGFYAINTTATSAGIGFHDEIGNPKSKRAYFYFDLTSIPSSANIDNVSFYARLNFDSNDIGHLVDFHAMDNTSIGPDPQSIYIDCGNGTLYINDSSSMSSGSPTGFYEWNLGALAVQDIQDNLTRGWFGIGIHEEGDNEERARLSTIEAGNADHHPQLNVSFNSSAAISFDDIAYVNQTFYKPNVTPNDPLAANLKFDYQVDEFQGTNADLIVEIDGQVVWGPYPISSTTVGMVPISLDVGQYMTSAKNYEISLQLHMDVNSQTNVNCAVKYDNINLTTLGYAWSGTFLSDILDPSTEVFWDMISWNSSTDSETDLSIRTQNSPDGSSWDPLSAPYNIPSGEQISPSEGRKIRYSVDLTTTNYSKTPKLFDISISYNRFATNGTLEMNSDYEPENLRNWGTLSWTHITNGETITYWYSTDSGNSWTQTLDGNLTGVSTSSGKIRFKTEFITGSGIITPILLEWNLTHEISELPTLFGGVNPSFGLITDWYNFSVRYSDPENDAPDRITINITQGTSHLGSWDMFETNSSDTNYTDGKWYYYNETNFLRGTNYTFHFAAKDPSGIWSIGTEINGPYVLNTPPEITTDAKLGAQGDVLYFNDYEADDLEDMGNLIWSMTTNVTSWLLKIDPVTGNLSGTPLLGDKGFYWVNVKVSDGHGGTDEVNFTLTVGDSQNPVADAGEDQEVYEDEIVTFNGSKSTDNIEIINYTWNLGGSAVYGKIASHIFAKSGNYIVALTVKDVIENQDIDTVYITVLNKAPIADAGSDITVNEGDLVYFNASGSYDTLSDNNSLLFLWDFDEDGHFNDAFGMNVSYIWYEPKTISAKLRVIDDDGDFSEDTIIVKVNNIEPEIDINDFYYGEKGDELIIVANAFHPGNTPLLFRWDWEDDGIWDTNFTTDFVINHTWNEEGQYNMVVQVSDGVSFASDSALVEITRHNNPPELADLGSRKIRYDEPFPIDLAQFITDVDNPLSDMIVTTDDREHISINGVQISLIYPQNMIGQTVDVLVTVSDGMASDSSILIVQITQNFPPILVKPFPDVVFNEDEDLINVFNLNDHIKDNDTSDRLTFDYISIDPNLIVEIDSSGFVSFKTTPNWAGSIDVRFLAEDPSGAFTDERVSVTVNSLNDEPFILKQIPSTFTTIGENGNWTIDLDDYFFDVDSFNVTFTCNYPEIKIDPITHEATWVPGDKKQLNDVRFTANDGEHIISLDPVDLKVVEEGTFNWLNILFAIIIPIVLILVYREMRYRFNIEEVFLVDNAGVLLVHMSRGESKTIDAKLVSGMLTAVQEFVKDSFRGMNGAQDIALDEGALGKLEYGDFQIVLERGTYTFLSAVISGYDNKRLRKRMNDVVDEFENKYSHVLADWDGDMAKFHGAEKIVGSLFKNHDEMKVTKEDVIGEHVSENQEENLDIDVADLPSGDFGDVPSYYEENNGGDFDKKEGSD